MQYSVSEVDIFGVRTQKNPVKYVKKSVLVRNMNGVWKPMRKTIVRAKANEFFSTLKPAQAYVFKILLTQIRKNPKMGTEELTSLVMRIIKNQKGKEVMSA